MTTVKRGLRSLYAECIATVQSHLRFGTNIYSYDWDALLILDACRVDALREVKAEYEFLTTIESRWSKGSTSKEWLENTFTESRKAQIESTAYITANCYSRHLNKEEASPLEYPVARDQTVAEPVFKKLIRDDVADASDFCRFVKLYDKVMGENIAQLPPETVTDSAIGVARESDCERYLIHYMQPHHPFIYADEQKPWQESPFEYLTNGGDFEKVWEGYLDNLRLVLDQVEVLLKNLDAETVIITADHGELFGEWGLHSHVVGLPHPKLRRVPWVETKATDTRKYQPDSVLDQEATDEELEERLEALGYR